MKLDSQIYDIIVIGGGASGLAAAIESATCGASVLVLEKGPTLGGTMAWAVGVYASSSTPHQKRADIEDSCEQHFADMDVVNRTDRPDNLDLRRLLVYGAPDTFHWLLGLGIRFIGPNLEPPQTQPRMHSVIPSAKAFLYYFERRCKKLGVSLSCSVEVVDLIVEGGRVRGVKAKNGKGETAEYHSRHGVIMASGDFAASRTMRSRFFGLSVVNAEAVYKLNTGDGQQIGERYGARIVNGDYATFYIPRMRFVPPNCSSWVLRLPPWPIVSKGIQFGLKVLPQRLMRPFLLKFLTTVLGPELGLFRAGAALVNNAGDLIEVDITSPAHHLALDPANKGYIIFDQKIANIFETPPNAISTAPGIAFAYLNDYRISRQDIYHEANTLFELAGKIGIAPERLRNALQSHNETTLYDRKLEQGPFYALGPVRGYINVTEGGLAVSDDLRVLDGNDEPIPGLFAAGGAGQGGVLLNGHGHHLTWALVSGRKAAQTALQQSRSFTRGERQ